MGFIYETHLHTSQASACAVTRGAEYIKYYRDLGFTGIMVTDHFFNSNTAIDRRKHWSEWVKRFCSGYEDAHNEGVRRGVDVFFGWEETYGSDDFLIYGLDKSWLLEHPEMVRWTREEQFREIRLNGGCVVHAHPFRQHSYVGTVRLSPYFIDAVEAANAGNQEAAYDALALKYAGLLSLPAVAGSDAHSTRSLGRNQGPYGIETAKKFSTINDYVSLLLNKQQAVLYIPQGRCEFGNIDGDRPLSLKTEILYHKNKSTGKSRMSFNEVAAYIKKAG